MEKQPSLKKNFIYNVIYEILILIIPLITSPYLTRTVGANGLGVYSFAQSYAQYFVLFIMLGLKNYGNREIAKVRDNKEQTNKTFSEIYAFQFLMMIVVSFVYIFALLTIIKEDRLIYWIQFLYVLSAGFDINWCCFGLEKFKLTVIRNAAVKIASAVTIFIFVKQPNDLWKYTLIIAGTTWLSQIVVWPFVLKQIGFTLPAWKGIVSRIRPNILLFFPVVAISLYTVMDKLMLGMMDTKTEVGYYAYAERIIQIPQAFITALGTVMFPRISNMLHNGKSKGSSILLGKSMQFAMLLSIGSMFGVMAISKELIPWYYGSDFSRCAIFTVWLAPVIALTSWNTIIRTQFVIPMGLDKVYLKTVSIGAVVNLMLNCALIPEFKGTGAVFATLVAQFTVCFVQYRLTRKGINFKVFIEDTVAFLIIGAMMGISVVAIPDFFMKDILNIFLKVLAGVISYGGLSLIYLMYVKKERWIVDSVIKILPGKKRK